MGNDWIEYYCKECGEFLVKINPQKAWLICGAASANCTVCGTDNKLYLVQVRRTI